MAVIILGLSALLAAFPSSLGLAPEIGLASALTLFTIGFWATGLLPEYVTSLIFMAAAMLLAAAPASVIFSGFTSTAFWLVFSGVILGAAVNQTGLAARLAEAMVVRLSSSYPRLIIGLVLVGVALAFVLPSTMGRVLLLVPIVLALAERVGFGKGRNGRTGMVLAAVLSTYLVPATILPANVPNMVLAGAADALLDIQLRYADYFFLHFPVLGAIKGAMIVPVILWLFPDKLAETSIKAEPVKLTSAGRRLSLVLLVTLALWATDFWHGISPAWIGLSAALVCLLPSVGILKRDSFAQLNTSPIFYVGGMLGLGAYVSASGLGVLFSAELLAILPLTPGADAQTFAGLSVTSLAVGLIATMPGVGAVLTPVAPELAATAGWPIMDVLMALVVGFSTAVLPYQVPPMLVALSLTGVTLAAATRSLVVMAVLTIIFLWPLDFLWWRFLGLPG
ncbi:MAG: SLC13 family permease [Pseudomonadota bacterium]